MNDYSPWVEKYRPKQIENIVLTDENRKILHNMMIKKYIPNLLFHGPPGTGKTTTILSFIEDYFKEKNKSKKGFLIHLNASDERGVEVIRNQINEFVNSKTMFENDVKFIVLDEVDYMTKSAQQALKYLLQNYNIHDNVRFCLICNYLNKIDESLRDEFVLIHFDNLPSDKINRFLQHIVQSEGMTIDQNTLFMVQNMFGSDLRSMINFLQVNIGHGHMNTHQILNNKVFDEFFYHLQTFYKLKNKNFDDLCHHISVISGVYGLPINEFIIEFLKYITFKNPFKTCVMILNYMILYQI